MPRNEADRVARSRAKQQREETKRQAEATHQSLLQQMQAEIPISLRWLAEHDYPGIAEVHIESNNVIKRWAGRPDTKGGWLLYREYGEDYDRYIYLLSDGRIAVMHGSVGFEHGYDRPMSPTEYFHPSNWGSKYLGVCLDAICKLHT